MHSGSSPGRAALPLGWHCLQGKRRPGLLASAMPTTVFLDVNETLLDLSALDPHFAAAFGDAQTRPKWFAELLQLALTHTVTGDYRDFSVLGEAALHALLDGGVDLGAREVVDVQAAQPRRTAGLTHLKESGFGERHQRNALLVGLVGLGGVGPGIGS